MVLADSLCQKVKPNPVKHAWLFLLIIHHQQSLNRRYGCIDIVYPPGGVSVQPSMDAGARQAAACGEGERGGHEPPEAGAEAPSKLLKSPWSSRDKKKILQC